MPLAPFVHDLLDLESGVLVQNIRQILGVTERLDKTDCQSNNLRPYDWQSVFIKA